MAAKKKKKPVKKAKIAKKRKKATKPKTKSKNTSPKPIGIVTHYFGKLGVAIIKFKKPVGVGARVRFRGATTDFEAVIHSMQHNHKDIKKAKKSQQVGVLV